MEKLYNKVFAATFDSLGNDTIAAAKRTLLDSLAAMVFGNNLEENLGYARSMAAGSGGNYPVFGTSIFLSPREAAFVNGCGSVATEMDEGQQWSKGHPGAHVLPALATIYSGKPGRSGKQFLIDLVRSYELCSRFGRAVTLHPSMHAHGTWGCVGAAAAGMFAEDTEPELFFHGLRLGASFAVPTMWEAVIEGATVRNAYAGHTAELGIKIPAMLNAGFRPPSDIFNHVFGTIIGSSFDPVALEVDLQDWEIEKNYFKPYAFCRYAHSSIDALAQILLEEHPSAEQILGIDVFTHQRAATLCNQKPHNVLSAKFSIPYAMGVYAARSSAGPDSFSAELFQNKTVREVASKTQVKFDVTLEQDYPNTMPARVEVKTQSGQLFIRRCDIALGGPGVPLNEDQLYQKFLSLTENVFSEARQESIFRKVQDLEHMSDITELLKLCVSDTV